MNKFNANPLLKSLPVSTIFKLSLLSTFWASALLAQPLVERVVPEQYIIQRQPVLASRSSTPTVRTYTTHKSHERFEIVSPSSSGASLRSSGSSTPEPYDREKVERDCDLIRQDPSVKSCEPNFVMQHRAVPNDQYFSLQWGLQDSIRNWDVDAPQAWDNVTGSNDTVVAVVDSGINWQHSDLYENIWRNPGDSTVDGIDNDGNGYTDDVLGIDAAAVNNSPWDCDGHGSHVAGIIGAKGNNGIGISGVNWNIKILPVKIFDGCGGTSTLESTLRALYYLYDLKKNRGINIVALNASYGGNIFKQSEKDAIAALHTVDIILVGAAGNEASNNDLVPSYPDGYNLSNIVSVAALNCYGQLASYSNYGSQWVDIAAPGGENIDGCGILSTIEASGTFYDRYDYKAGTSMAAPFVTGAIALLKSQRPYLSRANLISILRSSADPVQSLSGRVITNGLLNIQNMLLAADPLDNCPTDPAKQEPGYCGCNVLESYRDLDSDGLLDCLDTCPVDPNKNSAGVCGCGVSDNDLNGNGVSDCLDPKIDSLVPSKPKLKRKGQKVQIDMQAYPGVTYYLAVTVKSLKKKGSKPKTTYYTSDGRLGLLKFARGSQVTIQYAFAIKGSAPTYSYYSQAATIRVP